MLVNDGYFHATVDFECVKNNNKKRADAIYYLHERERYYVSSIDYDMEDETVGAIILADTASSLLRPGMPFSVDNMEFERRRITELLKNMGYYRFQKEYITYVADTAHHSNKVRLTMNLGKFIKERYAEPELHRTYRVRRIYYVSDAGLRLDDAMLAKCDTMETGNHTFICNDGFVVRPSVLTNNTHIRPGELYSQYEVDRTYNSFANLPALKYTTIRMVETPEDGMLDCYIMFERNKRMSVGLELEGTNTAGDFGAAASVTFSDKNLFKGSEMLSLRVFAAYEAVSGLSGYSGGDYLEYGAETSLRLLGGLPALAIPVINRSYTSSTLLSLKFNSQKRPEFDRHVLSGTWGYSWSSRPESMNTLELLDVNYIYVPWISDTFKKEYLDSISNRNSILKYNYENLLITKLGYTYTYNSSLKKSNQFNPYAYSVRMHMECSGNTLKKMLDSIPQELLLINQRKNKKFYLLNLDEVNKRIEKVFDNA
jgi:outer membrane protein assembly factor BamA